MNVSESCRQLDDVIPQHAFGQQTVLGEHGLLPKLLVFMLRIWPGGVGSTAKKNHDSSSSIIYAYKGERFTCSLMQPSAEIFSDFCTASLYGNWFICWSAQY